MSIKFVNYSVYFEKQLALKNPFYKSFFKKMIIYKIFT